MGDNVKISEVIESLKQAQHEQEDLDVWVQDGMDPSDLVPVTYIEVTPAPYITPTVMVLQIR